MFQYAACLAQARRLGVGLRLATGWYDTRPEFKYALRQWAGVGEEGVDEVPIPTVEELWPTYEPGLGGRVGDGAAIAGYWQDERYFLGLRRELLAAFRPRSLTGRAVATARLIGAEGGRSVALSVRRGKDYRELGFVLPTRYYELGCAMVAGAVADPCLFVFSDEPEWCAGNLRLPPYRMHVVAPREEPGTECEDLWLMSLCRHGVLANSSFSWWGAWLNPDPGVMAVPGFPNPAPPGWTPVGGWQ